MQVILHTSDNLDKLEIGHDKLHIPLNFWFNTDFKLNIPLIALQYILPPIWPDVYPNSNNYYPENHGIRKYMRLRRIRRHRAKYSMVMDLINSDNLIKLKKI
jgi:hypothetical protein